MTDIQSWLQNCRNTVNKALQKKLPPETQLPQNLHKAMHYAVLNGGKRLRAAFVFATGEIFGKAPKQLTDIAVVLELVHAFSLVHDDLPALDNDDLRRGKPSCHVAFGEATAILAGDALHSLAFEILAELDTSKIPSEVILAMTRILSRAIGSLGMMGGETLDVEAVDNKVSIDEIETIYKMKTGSLLSASLVLAALAADCQDNDKIWHLAKFGEDLGIAFQIHDDIIGITSDTSTLGKKQKADLDLNKPVYPIITSMETSIQRRNQLMAQAKKHLEALNMPCKRLQDLADLVISRNN